MKITIHTKNYNVSDKLRTIIEHKLEKVERYFDETAECTIVCSRVGTVERMELTITARGHAFRAQEENRSMYNNIDIVLAKIERQIIKNKEKLSSIIRDNATEEKRFMFAKTKQKFVQPEVKKNKAFPIRVLTDKQAELNMATLDYDFFVYADEATQGVKVMYRRNDGHVGVIEITNAALKIDLKSEVKKVKK